MIDKLKQLIKEWEEIVAKEEGEWYSDSQAYNDCADDLRKIVKEYE